MKIIKSLIIVIVMMSCVNCVFAKLRMQEIFENAHAQQKFVQSYFNGKAALEVLKRNRNNPYCTQDIQPYASAIHLMEMYEKEVEQSLEITPEGKQKVAKIIEKALNDFDKQYINCSQITRHIFDFSKEYEALPRSSFIGWVRNFQISI